MITLKKIAEEACTTVATVSMALRDSPRISAARKEEIKSIADRLGYRRNAHVSALMKHIRRGRSQIPARPVVAILIAHPDRDARRKLVFIDRRLRGSETRLAAAGYRPQVFWYNDPACPPERLQRILEARGIRGVVLALFRGFENNVTLSWDRFCVATQSTLPSNPGLHRVSEDYFANTLLAMTRLRETGCRRIGLAYKAAHAGNAYFHITAAHQRFQTMTSAGHADMPALHIPQNWNQADFMAWFKKSAPDAVLTFDWEVADWLRAAGIRVPEEVSVAVLNRCPSAPHLSGIDPCPELLGALCVDLVIEQLENNQLGTPAIPKVLSLPGQWIPGSTTRPPIADLAGTVKLHNPSLDNVPPPAPAPRRSGTRLPHAKK